MKNYVYVDTTTFPITYMKVIFEGVPENAPEIVLYRKEEGDLRYVDIYSEEMEISSYLIMQYADRL